MKKHLKNMLVLLAVLLAVFCIAPQAQAATPKLNKTKATLVKGNQIKLKVTGTAKKVKWSSNNKKVATVTSKGVVKAKKKGIAKITAKVGKKKLVCRVTVETPKLNKTRLTVNVGEKSTLKLTGTTGKVKWIATNKSVATVTQKGVVRGVGVGRGWIRAQVRGKEFLCMVDVVNKPTANLPPANPTWTPLPNPTTTPIIQPVKTYAMGETWVVNGQWRITVNSVQETSHRNPYTEKKPSAVYLVTYTYENIGYVDRNGIMDGLYVDMEDTIVDATGRMGYSYPGDQTLYAKETPVGATCIAQACIGVDNPGGFKIHVTKYDGNGNKQSAIFSVNL